MQKLITEDIPGRVAADAADQNARKNSDQQKPRIEHDKPLARVMTAVLRDDTELFKQFMDNEGFRRWMTDTVFALTFASSGREVGSVRPKRAMRSTDSSKGTGTDVLRLRCGQLTGPMEKPRIAHHVTTNTLVSYSRLLEAGTDLGYIWELRGQHTAQDNPDLHAREHEGHGAHPEPGRHARHNTRRMAGTAPHGVAMRRTAGSP